MQSLALLEVMSVGYSFDSPIFRRVSCHNERELSFFFHTRKIDTTTDCLTRGCSYFAPGDMNVGIRPSTGDSDARILRSRVRLGARPYGGHHRSRDRHRTLLDIHSVG